MIRSDYYRKCLRNHDCRRVFRAKELLFFMFYYFLFYGRVDSTFPECCGTDVWSEVIYRSVCAKNESTDINKKRREKSMTILAPRDDRTSSPGVLPVGPMCNLSGFLTVPCLSAIFHQQHDRGLSLWTE